MEYWGTHPRTQTHTHMHMHVYTHACMCAHTNTCAHSTHCVTPVSVFYAGVFQRMCLSIWEIQGTGVKTLFGVTAVNSCENMLMYCWTFLCFSFYIYFFIFTTKKQMYYLYPKFQGVLFAFLFFCLLLFCSFFLSLTICTCFICLTFVRIFLWLIYQFFLLFICSDGMGLKQWWSVCGIDEFLFFLFCSVD